MDSETRSTRTTLLEEESAGLKWRLARAESGRDTWRVAGVQENCLGACSMVDALDFHRREMAELCITFNGRKYGYRGYRYDRFADAANYARLDRSRAFAAADEDAGAPLERTPAPRGEDLELMRPLGVSFADGVFHWREYRYERLDDAVAYARREQARANREGSRSLTLRRR